MQPKSVRLQNFRLFADSGDVPLGRTTVLLAQNENGKTAFLQGLAWFSSGEQLPTEDFWQGASYDGSAPVATVVFNTQQHDVDALKRAGIVLPRALQVTRDASGRCRFIDSDSEGWVGSGAEEEADAAFVSARDELLAMLRALKPIPAGVPVRNRITSLVTKLAASPFYPVGEVGAIGGRIRTQLMTHLATEDGAPLEGALSALESAAAECESQLSASAAALRRRLPRFVYFDGEVDIVPDRAEYSGIAADPSSHRTILNLAQLAGVRLDRIPTDPHERQRLARKFERTISAETSRHWRGHPVTFELDLDDSGVTVSIASEGRQQKPSRRSRGMRWYHGFHINFLAEIGEDLDGAVLLLDEPGLFLHPSAQEGLLELFEEIASRASIVYTTHLPFMIPRSDPARIRLLVEQDDGTVRVESSFHAKSDADVLKPLRAAIGIGIADTITLGAHSVICEGIADLYILRAASAFAEASGRTCLRRTEVLLPAGGVDKVVTLASFLVGEFAKGLVLLDDDSAGRRIEGQIRKRFAGTVPVLRTHASLVDDSATGLELEDLFDPEYYCELVNESHIDVGGFAAIAPAELSGQGPVVDQIKSLFQSRGYGGFQKLRPAQAFMARVEGGSEPSNTCLDRFGDLFERIRGVTQG